MVGCPIRSPWCGVQSEGETPTDQAEEQQEKGVGHFPVGLGWSRGISTNLSVFLDFFSYHFGYREQGLSLSLCLSVSCVSLSHTPTLPYFLLVGFFCALSGICRKEFITLSPQVLRSSAFSLMCSVSPRAVYILYLGVLAVFRRKRGSLIFSGTSHPKIVIVD